jgi:hypothetical protein
VWKRWNAAGTTTTTIPPKRKKRTREREEVSQCVGLGGIFRQLMDDVGSGGKRREERKKKDGGRIPGHLACRRFCTCTSCRRSIPTPKEEKCVPSEL